MKVAEGMGWEIVEEEIPIAYEELIIECQYALELFNCLPDKIEGMSGIWLGKDFSGLGEVMNLLSIPQDIRGEVFIFLQHIIADYSRYYEDRRKAAETQAESKAKAMRAR